MKQEDAQEGVGTLRSIGDGNQFSSQSSMQVAGEALSSKGAAIVPEDLMGLETNLGGGGVRSTSLAKREC
jgi:hypothetical protein